MSYKLFFLQKRDRLGMLDFLKSFGKILNPALELNALNCHSVNSRTEEKGRSNDMLMLKPCCTFIGV